jgi:2-keto-4-pentenoate hydratase
MREQSAPPRLEKGGHELKAGDLISVGSFSPLVPLKAGQTVTTL